MDIRATAKLAQIIRSGYRKRQLRFLNELRPSERRMQRVGRVERSDAHQLQATELLFAKLMGFAEGSTHTTG
jgi:hypothetical protein